MSEESPKRIGRGYPRDLEAGPFQPSQPRLNRGSRAGRTRWTGYKGQSS